MTCYFVIVGHNDNPLFELEYPPRPADPPKIDDKRHLNQFVAHAALDLVDEAKWQSGNLHLKTVDKFNDLTVNGFVTASHMRFLIVHDTSKSQESMKNFFQEAYELFVKATLNPFYTPNTPITSNSFKKKANALARKYLA
ncbi:trafficking protein particle complex subunit 2-like [Halichondria panicea]|uniref:trafficking protein particle complex subunit 2-like n=1 Tax=Halichondria panicea TaxID=6063 RepID=UPI00312B932E